MRGWTAPATRNGIRFGGVKNYRISATRRKHRSFGNFKMYPCFGYFPFGNVKRKRYLILTTVLSQKLIPPRGEGIQLDLQRSRRSPEAHSRMNWEGVLNPKLQSLTSADYCPITSTATGAFRGGKHVLVSQAW